MFGAAGVRLRGFFEPSGPGDQQDALVLREMLKRR